MNAKKSFCKRSYFIVFAVDTDPKKSNSDKFARTQLLETTESVSSQSERWNAFLEKVAPGERWDVPWGSGIVLQVLGLWILCFIGVGSIVLPASQAALKNLEIDGPRGQAVFLLLNYLLEMGTGAFVMQNKLSPFAPLPSDMFQYRADADAAKWGIGGLLMAVAVVVVASLLNAALVTNGQPDLQEISKVLLGTDQDLPSVAMFIFTVSFLAPVWEETLFRGFLLPSFSKFMPMWQAIPLSAAFFGAAHLSVQHMIPLTALGCVLGYVYSKSRNLAASIAVHSLWNTLTVVLLLTFGDVF